MDQISWAEIIAIIVAIIASMPAVLHFFRTRFKDKAEGIAIVHSGEKAEADATGAIVTSAMALLEPYVKRVEELEQNEREREVRDIEILARIRKLERNNYVLCEGLRRLIHQIRSFGAEPVFDISEGICDEMNNVEGTEVNDGHLT